MNHAAPEEPYGQPQAFVQPNASTDIMHRYPTSKPSSSSSTLNAMPIPTPKRHRIGPYRLGKTLGVGSTGHVKLGTHIETGETVAIKIILKNHFKNMGGGDKTTKEDIRKKMEREITIMKLIRHPNVLKLHDVYESDTEVILILEYVEGGELFDHIVKKGRLSEDEALDFFQQLIFAVEYSHQHFVCHRDLKPENLLLDGAMNLKIADFGMANLQGPGRLLETSCGSPHYASPEVIKGIKYDGPTADIWSCGIILYALLTGNLPFDDDNIRKLLSKVKQGVFHVPSFVCHDARHLIKRMLTVDPLKRITMREIMEHPWFNSRTPRNLSILRTLPSPLQATVMRPQESIHTLDPEILHSLALLGWDDEQALLQALVCSRHNVEKVFYQLLMKRKSEMRQGLDLYRLKMWDIEGGPKRRMESFGSFPGVRNKQIMLSKPIQIPCMTRPGTNASPNGSPASTMNNYSSSSMGESMMQHHQSKQEVKEMKPAPSSETAYVKEETNETMLASSQSRMATDPSKNASIASSEGIKASAKKSRSKEKMKMSDSSVNITQRSWFANLFHSRPEVYSLPMPSRYVFAQLGIMLTSLKVQFQERIEKDEVVSYKCKFENEKNSVKFRLNWEAGQVKCIHQQGSHSLFMEKVKQMEQVFRYTPGPCVF